MENEVMNTLDYEKSVPSAIRSETSMVSIGRRQ